MPSTSLASRLHPPTGAPVAALTGALLLAGCSSAVSASTEEGVGAALEDVDVESLSGGADGPTLAASGEQYAVGDPAVIHVATTSEASDPGHRHLVLASTVVDVREAGDATLDALSGRDVSGEAYEVRVDHRILTSTGSGTPDEDWIPALIGMAENGQNLQTFQAGPEDDALGDCAAVPFTELEPGGVARSCLVAFGVDGVPVGGAAWPGDPVADGEDPDSNPYLAFPVVWMD